MTIVHSKKTEPWQPQLVGWFERRPLHDPNKVFAYWSKKKTTTFGAKTIVLFKKLGTGCGSQPLPSEHSCVWPLKVLISCYWAFFGFMAVIFSGWGSRVGGLLISETSIFTIDNGEEAGKGRTTEPWRSPPNRQRRSALKKARLLWHKKSSGILFCTSTYRGYCCRPLCIAPVQLQCKVIGDWPLRATRGNGICTTHNCSERLLVGQKAKPLIFARKKESCFPKVEYTWNWNVRRTKASLRHWKRENWNIFENIWKKSNTPQGSVFLEWTIELAFSSKLAMADIFSFPHSVHLFAQLLTAVAASQFIF